MAHRVHGLRYCEVCNGYSTPEANVSLHLDSYNSVMTATSEGELQRLYDMNNDLLVRTAQLEELVEQQRQQIQDHQIKEMNGSAESMTRQWLDLERRYGSLLGDYAALKERTDRAAHERRQEKWIEENRRQRLLQQIENLEGRLMAGGEQNRRLLQQIENLEERLMADGGQVTDASTQRERREWAADRPATADLWMVEANIVLLSKQSEEQSVKIRQLETIIDMQNRRLQEKDRTFHRLMVKHKTLMKED